MQAAGCLDGRRRSDNGVKCRESHWEQRNPAGAMRAIFPMRRLLPCQVVWDFPCGALEQDAALAIRQLDTYTNGQADESSGDNISLSFEQTGEKAQGGGLSLEPLAEVLSRLNDDRRVLRRR
jgi:hypothetical protein